MGLDNLRKILLSERETGRLTSTSPDFFEREHAELAALVEKVYAFDDPLSEEARSIIEETLAIRETLYDIFVLRSRKILALSMIHTEGNYYDREEIKRMTPPERRMFDTITASVEECESVILKNAAHPVIQLPDEDDAGEPVVEEVEGPGASAEVEAVAAVQENACAAPRAKTAAAIHYSIVRVLQDMDAFMGVDGKIYSLAKGDIVTLPGRNAEVLGERNIVLNINLLK
jgi:DNA replication factor GINS